MRQVFSMIAVTVTIGLLVMIPLTYGQDKAAPAPEKIFSGQLSKIDASAKSVSVKDSENKEMTFSYTEQTEVVGVENNVQGLTGKTGTQVRISYREDRGSNIATKIELVQK